MITCYEITFQFCFGRIIYENALDFKIIILQLKLADKCSGLKRMIFPSEM